MSLCASYSRIHYFDTYMPTEHTQTHTLRALGKKCRAGRDYMTGTYYCKGERANSISSSNHPPTPKKKNPDTSPQALKVLWRISVMKICIYIFKESEEICLIGWDLLCSYDDTTTLLKIPIPIWLWTDKPEMVKTFYVKFSICRQATATQEKSYVQNLLFVVAWQA